MTKNHAALPAIAVAVFVALAPLPSLAEDTPVPLPCEPEDCGPVPNPLPGCPTCKPDPAPGQLIE